jgi:hypothetical protein
MAGPLSTVDIVMHLTGWTNPLPDFVVQAIEAGTVVVYVQNIKGVEYQLLKGVCQSPYGYTVEYQ